MNDPTISNWYECNQKHLMAALAVVRENLERYRAARTGSAAPTQSERPGGNDARTRLAQAAEALPAPSALGTAAMLFGLSSFERDVLLLCAGQELDSQFAQLLASIPTAAPRPSVTFSLALAALPDAHWSAVAPSGPLRYWQLIEVSSGDLLMTSPLRICERVLHYLTGVSYLDERLAGLVESVPVAGGPATARQQALAERLEGILSRRTATSTRPFVQLCGTEVAAKRSIAACACDGLGLSLWRMRPGALPSSLGELDTLARLWEREASLGGYVLLVDCDELDPSDTAALAMYTALCERLQSALIVTSRERVITSTRATTVLHVEAPSGREGRGVWKNVLGAQADTLDGQLGPLVSQFNLDTGTIRQVCSEVLDEWTSEGEAGNETAEGLGRKLWQRCRVHSRTHLDGLAHRVRSLARWDDLVLPDTQMRMLKEIAIQVRQRSRVYEEWGFCEKSSRGLGIAALFAGDSGTGKTMASEVLANELALDLYRIDLSRVVSKYIGQTEENLRKIFDAAQKGGAILLFDEADALYGKRSEVRDSHDRYANIEVSYLLQCMEDYRGLAILTTNMKSNLDKAFFRRIRFVVQFPFPDHAQRARIWEGIFPEQTPTQDLDIGRLARLSLTGGSIRNVALNAAFLAAEADTPVRMEHLWQATRREYTKLEKPLSSTEIGRWE